MIETLSSAMLAWLLTYAIHSTALLGLAWALTRARAWSPAASDLLWKTALVGGIVTATVQLRFDVRPTGSISLRRDAPAEAARVVAVPEADTRSDVNVASDEPHAITTASIDPAASSAAPPSPRPTTHGVAVLAWAIIAGVLALSYAARRLILVGRIGDRLAVDDPALLAELGRLARDAGLRNPPRLTSTVRISSPIALGIGEICVPETALIELDLEQQRSMLAHELAHLARRDPVWLAFASLIERVLWFQPLNRIARRQIATSAEYLCDEWAVRRTGSRVALARCLAQVAEWIQASPLGVPVAGMAEERSLLVSRVEKLLDGEAPVSRSRRVLALAAASVVLVTVAVAPSVTGKSARATSLGADFGESKTDSGSPAIGALGTNESDSDGAKPNAQRSAADSAVVLALIVRLKDEDADVRVAAAEALGKLEDARAVPGLLETLRDREAKVRSAAAQSLGKFHDSRAIGGLTALLQDSSAEVRKEALNALSEFESGVSVAAVIRLLDDPDAELRHAAAHTLGNQKDRAAGAALAKAVRDPSSDVRQAAIEAIAQLHDASQAPAILPALSDPNADVRRQALDALSDLRSPIAEGTLLGLMRDANADVRAKAAEIAGERSILGAIPSLRRLLDDPDHDVREHAVSALSEIADPAADEALRAALTSKDASVRRNAVEALGDRRQ
ncbi:MAG TPA: M56 family metallopeptidase [Gemmatimonadaceae bacterium]|nr:M56 family metallopeptidase [Gemmatimonadaceae bacterium]